MISSTIPPSESKFINVHIKIFDKACNLMLSNLILEEVYSEKYISLRTDIPLLN